ncbi:MAG: alpha/beta hydrolase [Bdellovibrionota bacterium]
MKQDTRIVFIHGFMGSALNWGRVRGLLEEKVPGLKSFAIDLLGHALNHPKSVAAPGQAHAELCKDLKSQLSAIKPTHVVAHSFGLRPALDLADTNPELIPHLIVEDSSPELSPQAHAFLMSVINAPVPFRTREEAKIYFDNKYGAQSALSRFFFSNIRTQEDGLANWRFDKNFLEALLNEAIRRDLWDLWKTLPSKLSLIYGEQSDSFPAEVINKMKALRPDMKAYPIAKAGHWVHSDQPLDFVEVLSKIILGDTSN